MMLRVLGGCGSAERVALTPRVRVEYQWQIARFPPVLIAGDPSMRDAEPSHEAPHRYTAHLLERCCFR